MPVIITNRKFYTDYFNGDDFSLNTSDNQPFLYGGVTTYTKALYDVSMEFGKQSTASDTWTRNVDLLTSSSIGFDDALSIGDIVDVESFDNGVSDNTASGLVVTGMGDNYIIIDGLEAAGFTRLQYDGGQYVLVIRSTTACTGFLMKYGLINNDESINYLSKLDGTEQGYYAGDVGFDTGGGVRDTNFVDAKFLGAYKGMETGSLRIRYVDNPDVYTQRFEIEHIFLNIPYFQDGEDANIDNLDPPLLFEDNNSIKYAVRFEFRDVLSNSNTSKVVEDAFQSGSVGWWNSNYNGFNNEFSISGLSYEDQSGNPADSLIVGSLTKVNFTVSSLVNAFVDASSIINVFVSYLPPLDDYTKQKDTYTEIWEIEKYRDTLGNNTATGQTIIQNVLSTFTDAQNIDIELDIQYSSKTNADRYIIGIEVADDGVESGASLFVPLLVDFNTFQKAGCIEGLATLDTLTLKDFRGNEYGSYGGFIEDALLLEYDFKIDHDREVVINNMQVGFFAFNPTTGDQFDILMENLPFEVIANKNDGTYDYQEISTNQDTGYKLEENDPYRYRTINTGSLVGSERSYNGSIGLKVPYQAWVQLPNASDEFITLGELFDGKNLDASNYASLNGYEVRAGLRVNLTGNDDLGNNGNTDYYLTKVALELNSYGNDDYTVTFETFDQNDDPLNGAILSNEDTKVKVTITPNAGSLNTNHVGVFRIEPSQSPNDRAIYEHNELSVKANYLENSFVGNLVKTLNGSSLEFTSEIKKEFITEGIGYKQSIMLRFPATPTLVFFTNIDPLLDGAFDPSIIAGTNDYAWYFQDGSVIVGKTVNTTGNGLNGTIQQVQLTAVDFADVTDIFFNNDKIYGEIDLSQLVNLDGYLLQNNTELTSIINPVSSTVITNYQAYDTGITSLDLSTLTGLGGNVRLYNTPNLTSIINPTSSETFSTYYVYSSNLSTLDLSGLTGLGGDFRANNNSNLTSIKNPISTESIGIYFAYNCNLSTLDLSGLTGLGGSFRVYDNSNLTQITLPTSSEIFGDFQAQRCDLTGELDVSTLTGLGGSFVVDNNANLTSINNPVCTRVFSLYWCYNCDITTLTNLTSLTNMTGVNNHTFRAESNNMTTAEVNKILVDLDTISVGGFTGRSINISGTNAAPDGSAGGNDGTTAVANLVSKGFTVTTS